VQAITFNIWSVVILLGAAQGLFLALYLFTKSENRNANKWLALLLTTITLHLFEYGANISGISMIYPFLLASTYPVIFCIGPFFYIYCRYLLDSNYKVGVKSVFHVVPVFLVLLMMLPFYTMSTEQKSVFIQDLESNGQLVIPVEQIIFMAIHMIQTTIYIYVSYRFVLKKEKELKQATSNVLLVKKINWLHKFSLYFSIYMALYFLLVVVLTYIDSYQLQIDYVMLLIMSLSLYAIGYSAIQNPEVFKALPKQELQIGGFKASDSFSVIKNSNKFPVLREKLLQFMDTGKPYLKNDLKISDLADSLSVPYHQLSQLINDEFNVNFYDFINKYRVEDAKKLLRAETRNPKMLAVAYEVGFNSKATFNRVFKKFTGLTPSEYRDKNAVASGKASVSGV